MKRRSRRWDKLVQARMMASVRIQFKFAGAEMYVAQSQMEQFPKSFAGKQGRLKPSFVSCVKHFKIGVRFARFGNLQTRLELILLPTKESLAVTLKYGIHPARKFWKAYVQNSSSQENWIVSHPFQNSCLIYSSFAFGYVGIFRLWKGKDGFQEVLIAADQHFLPF